MVENEVQVLADYCRLKLDLQNTILAEEYGYTSLPLCIIDTIFVTTQPTFLPSI